MAAARQRGAPARRMADLRHCVRSAAIRERRAGDAGVPDRALERRGRPQSEGGDRINGLPQRGAIWEAACGRAPADAARSRKPGSLSQHLDPAPRRLRSTAEKMIRCKLSRLNAKESRMRTALVTSALMTAVLVAPTRAEDAKSAFITTSDGIKIHYLELGRSGTPVILIHGYTANAEGKWIKSNIAQTLAKNHRVIAIDARGHGKSDKPHDPNKYGPRMAADVIELMDRLKIAKAHIHGYSMGGGILTQLLARHHDRIISAIYGAPAAASGCRRPSSNRECAPLRSEEHTSELQ